MKQFKKKLLPGLIISLVGMSAFAQSSGVSTQAPSTTGSNSSGVSTQGSGTSNTGGVAAPTIPGLPPLVTQDTTNQGALLAQGCNPLVMQNLNSQYLTQRTLTRQQQYNNEMNTIVATTPKSNTMDCFQQAMQSIQNLKKSIDAIMALFSGNMDMGALLQQIVNMVLKAACQEVNAVTGSLVSNTLNPYTNTINNTMGAVTGAQIGVAGQSTTVGGLLGNQTNSSATTPINVFGGSATSIGNTMGGVSSTFGTVSNTGSTLANKISTANPFGN